MTRRSDGGNLTSYMPAPTVAALSALLEEHRELGYLSSYSLHGDGITRPAHRHLLSEWRQLRTSLDISLVARNGLELGVKVRGLCPVPSANRPWLWVSVESECCGRCTGRDLRHCGTCGLPHPGVGSFGDVNQEEGNLRLYSDDLLEWLKVSVDPLQAVVDRALLEELLLAITRLFWPRARLIPVNDRGLVLMIDEAWTLLP